MALDGTNSRLDRLERRQAEAEVRISTELVAVVGAIHEMKEVFLEDRRLAAQVNDHESRIQALERRGPGWISREFRVRVRADFG